MDRKQKKTEFDAQHAAARLVLLEDIHVRIQKADNDRLSHRNAVKQKLIEVLSGLRMGVSQKAHISDAADYILEAFHRSEHLDKAIGRNGGTSKSEKELTELFNIGQKLNKWLGDVHRDTLVAMGGRDRSHFETALKLQRMANEILDHALIGSRTLPSMSSKAAPPAEKKQARAVTVAAIYVYEGLTGRRASRCHQNESKDRAEPPSGYGETRDFLGDIYEVLGITAKPEGQLKSVLPLLPEDDLRPKPKRGRRPSKR